MQRQHRPFYARQRLLLALVAAHSAGVGDTDIQKKMFLLVREYLHDDKPPYQFFPYKYGGYSLQCQRDVGKLAADRWLHKNNDRWLAAESMCFIGAQQQRALGALMDSEAGGLSGGALVKHVYEKYPQYAINSEIIGDFFLPAECERVQLLRPAHGAQMLFTVGYEGISFECYINRLIENNVKLLIDVRANPLSRKPGFSKSTMKKILGEVKIGYEHLPELGIMSAARRDLSDFQSRQQLFAEYRRARLSHAGEALDRIRALLLKHRRAALTCFESKPQECHRHCISDEMQKRFADVQVRHI